MLWKLAFFLDEFRLWIFKKDKFNSYKDLEKVVFVKNLTMSNKKELAKYIAAKLNIQPQEAWGQLVFQ